MVFCKGNIKATVCIVISIFCLSREVLARGHGHSHVQGRSQSHGHSKLHEGSHSNFNSQASIPFWALFPPGNRNAINYEEQRCVLKENKPTTIIIGEGVQSVFLIENKKVNQVIGEGFTYDIKGNFLEDYVLITPTDPNKKQTSITLVLEDGKHYTMNLIIKGEKEKLVVVSVPE